LVALRKCINSTGGINTKLLREGDHKGDHSNYGKIIKLIFEKVAMRNMNQLQDGVQIELCSGSDEHCCTLKLLDLNLLKDEARFLNLLWRNKWVH
jgi:hypothetical protein